MSAAHTPGPWVNCYEQGRWKKYPKLEVRTEWGLIGGSVGYAPIARVIGDKRVANHAQRLADLRLIAAAPDLLAALIAAYDYVPPSSPVYQSLADAINKAVKP